MTVEIFLKVLVVIAELYGVMGILVGAFTWWRFWLNSENWKEQDFAGAAIVSVFCFLIPAILWPGFLFLLIEPRRTEE